MGSDKIDSASCRITVFNKQQADGKLTLKTIQLHGRDYNQYECFPINVYTRSEMETSIKSTENRKKITNEQITALLNRLYSSRRIDYSIKSDTLTLGESEKYVKQL